MCCKSSDSWILLCNNGINHVFAHSFALGGATHPAERKKEETRAEMLMQPPPHMRSDMKKDGGKERKREDESRKLTRGGFQQRSSFQEGERPF